MKPKLASHGGPRVRETPLVPEEHLQARFGEEEKRALAEVIDSGHLCRVFGQRARQFERQAAEYFGVAHAVAVTSGTAAIHCALAAIGVGHGDEVITSPITDMGSVIPILTLNAIPVFADVDPKTFNITAEAVEKSITDRTKAIIPVHLAGQSCVMEPIISLAKERGLHVVEDCAQSYLSTCDGRQVGTIGDAGCFSLNDFKHITCGDGGFLISDDEELISRAALFADKGYPRTGPVRNSLILGMNYRITELQAAVAGVQLRKLASIVQRRRQFANTLNGLLSRIEGVQVPHIADGIEHSYWFYAFTVDSGRLGATAAAIAKEVTAEGVPVTFPYLGMPVYLFDSIKRTLVCGSEVSFHRGLCPNAEMVLEEMMVLPCNECMSERDARDIADAIGKVCGYHLSDGIQP